MFFYEGLSCPVCGKAFLDTDDIVACPDCGAPHHRACWQQTGHCAFKNDHGTENEWRRDKAARVSFEQADKQPDNLCPNCGASNPPYAEFCSTCGSELSPKEWSSSANPHYAPNGSAGPYSEYSPFRAPVMDPFGGIPNDKEIGGETAETLAAVVGPQSNYYLPRFDRMESTGAKALWNWPAFLIPTYWLLYRKQHLIGMFMLLFSLLQTAITFYIVQMYFSPILNEISYTQMFAKATELLQGNSAATTAAILLVMLSFTDLLLRVIMGLFGNRLYYRHCLHIIDKTRNTYPEGFRAQLSVAGGTSIALAAVAYIILQLVPMMFSMIWQ